MNKLVLPSYFFGDVIYWINCIQHPSVGIAKNEIYQKQSPRNHTVILGPNGKQKLTVPVKGQKGEKTPISQILIHRSESYIKDHLQSISTAYGAAPFFESFFPLIEVCYNKNFEKLLHLNQSLNEMICAILKIKELETIDSDAVENISVSRLQPSSYPQVFSYKHGFIPNLSIMDLIFNEGPNAKKYLLQHLLVD